VLRALAARNLLQQRKILRRCAAGNPDIQASRSGNDTVKDQVAGLSRLLLTRLLLPQHHFADAARAPLRRSQSRQSGHSTRLHDVKSKTALSLHDVRTFETRTKPTLAVRRPKVGLS
jgi:hypothetical protein